jgi:hypothetical protein
MNVARLEQQIVIALGIKRRVEINQIDALVFDLVAENVKVVPVIQRVHGREIRETSFPRQFFQRILSAMRYELAKHYADNIVRWLSPIANASESSAPLGKFDQRQVSRDQENR